MTTSGSPLARPLQRVAGVIVALCTGVLFVGGALLALRGRVSASSELVLQLHVYAGLALLPALVLFVGSHLTTHLGLPNPRARRFGLGVAFFALGGCLSGMSLWLAPVDRDSGWLVDAHILAFALASALYLAHRLSARLRRALSLEKVILPFAAAAAFGLWLQPDTPPADPRSPDSSATSATVFDPGLSAARTHDGHNMSLEQLHDPSYCAACHPAIHERWSQSAHRFSSLTDPYYLATLKLIQASRPPRDLSFCGGCHDPALLLSGAMTRPVSPEQPGADFGISCLSCHAVTESPRPTGNASYTLGPGTHRRDYPIEDEAAIEASTRAIRSSPQSHRQALSKAWLRSSEFCRACHKASLTPELNGHRWLRGQNEFDPWDQSGAGGNSARTFYSPGPTRRCQDCHMPRIDAEDPAARGGQVSDHAFPGSNGALPAALGHAQWEERSREFMQGVISLDLGAVEVRRGDETRRILAPSGPLDVRSGDQLTLEFVVRNEGVGHLFPGGIADLREVWLELSVLDDEGELLMASGLVDPRDEVDPSALRWGTILLDAEGNVLSRHEVERAHVVLDSRRIMLGASDLARLRLVLPPGARELQARLLDRKFAASYQRFALGEDSPAPPTTLLASHRVELGTATPDVAFLSTDGARLRNLGIAHLLRGDTTLSREASRLAAELMPDDPGPLLDLARAALADGELDQVEAHLRDADQRRPGHPTGAWLLARLRAAQGRHVDALVALDLALESHPRDRQLLVTKGEYLLRLERFEEAKLPLRAALEIDPESLSAHTLLAEIATELGDETARARHQSMADRLRPHSQDLALTETARKRDPALDRRANRQFVLDVEPAPPRWSRVVVSGSN